jgi:predicted DNA-binding antitoxin AbrB/MazE fold protein
MSRSEGSNDSATTQIVHAVYENGVFHPRGPVALPEGSEVEFEPRLIAKETIQRHRERVHALLARSIVTGEPDMAERHDEPLP